MAALFAFLALFVALASGMLRLRPRLAPFLALLPLGCWVWLGLLRAGARPQRVWEWAAGLGVRFSFSFDGLGWLFASLICGIGVLVYIYAGVYLAGDSRIGRFYSYLTLFFASMLGLVLADNVIVLFVFWELTSLSSFLLIGYDHHRPQAREAALQTLLVTGLGGLALLAGLLLLASAGGSFELSELMANAGSLRERPLFAPAMALILAGAMTKSAQFPFHFWLPSAMEAPTPVSAYLHSATMVKAGVYLLARLSPAGAGTPLWGIVAAVGLVTMVTGFAMALPQRDAKRLLAYSTVGALGMLTLLIGIGTPQSLHAAMAVLLAHALYKASLFLFAGAFDHVAGTRDVYEWSGFFRTMPGPAVMALLAGASMAGVPPMFGYVVKEQMLTSLWGLPGAQFLYMAASAAAGVCSVAIAGILTLRPLSGPNPRMHAPSFLLWGPPALLAALGLVAGLAPGMADRWLAAPAAQAAAVVPPSSHLSLWHGFNLPALVSLAVLLAGALLYTQSAVVALAGAKLRFLSRYGPVWMYEICLKAVLRFAQVETRLLQSGKLRYYMTIVLLTATGLAFHALFGRGGVKLSTDWGDLRVYEIVLAVIMASAAAAALVFESRLAAVAALGVAGLGVALLFLLFGAPDLAITQFVVETLTVILLVLVLYHLPRFSRFSSMRARLRDLAVALSAGALLTVALLGLNGLGRGSALAPYFTSASVPEAHGRNVVNVILVDFRALDTLGEITVLTIAAIGVYSLLKLRIKSGGQS